MKLSIVIVNWNTKELLRRCLLSIEQKNKRTKELKNELEIIVVDNGSTDGSLEMIKKLEVRDKRIKLIKNSENLGFSKGNNIGIKAAKGEYIMLLNSDTEAKPAAIGALVSFLDENPGVSIVGPRLLNYDDTPQPSCGKFPDLQTVFLMLFCERFGAGRWVRWSPRISGFVDWMMGAAFMFRKGVFAKIGGLDEEMFMYMEEVEWFYRAKKAGFLAFFLKDAEIFHLGRGSSKTGKKDPILNIYKGLLHFYRRHKKPFSLLALRMMLKLKALLSLTIGVVTGNDYLKDTYGEAFKIA